MLKFEPEGSGLGQLFPRRKVIFNPDHDHHGNITSSRCFIIMIMLTSTTIIMLISIKLISIIMKVSVIFFSIVMKVSIKLIGILMQVRIKLIRQDKRRGKPVHEFSCSAFQDGLLPLESRNLGRI